MEFIHLLRRKHPTPFCLFNLFSSPSQKMRARVIRDDTFFKKKIAHLAILMKTTPLLEKISSCGLLSRLWILVVVNVHLINYNYFI